MTAAHRNRKLRKKMKSIKETPNFLSGDEARRFVRVQDVDHIYGIKRTTALRKPPVRVESLRPSAFKTDSFVIVRANTGCQNGPTEPYRLWRVEPVN
jgi:hypothetical protein